MHDGKSSPFERKPLFSEHQPRDYVKGDGRVTFSSVKISSYAIVIGDQDCEDGLLILLDWKYNPQPTIEVVESEDEVSSRHHPARPLSYLERTMLLLEVYGINMMGDLLRQEKVDATAKRYVREFMLNTSAQVVY